MSEVGVSPEVVGYAAKRLVLAARREDPCFPENRCGFCRELALVTSHSDLLYQVLFLLSVRVLERLTADGYFEDGESIFFHADEDDTEPDDIEVGVTSFVYLIQCGDFAEALDLFRDMRAQDTDGDISNRFTCVFLRTVTMVPIEL